MKRIIIVEDDIILSILMEKEIRRMGHEVTAKVDSAEAAIAKVKQDTVDLVLMDISLVGEMDGIEAMSHIYKFSEAQVIYITGNSDESTKKRAQKTRPAGYLIKPLNTRILKELISKTLEKSRNNN